MVDEPENLVLKQLAALRGAMDARFDKVEGRLEAVEIKIGAMAGTLIGVQRDLKDLRRDVGRLDDTVTTVGIATAANNDRLDVIEKHLGIDRPNLFPPT